MCVRGRGVKGGGWGGPGGVVGPGQSGAQVEECELELQGFRTQGGGFKEG